MRRLGPSVKRNGRLAFLGAHLEDGSQTRAAHRMGFGYDHFRRVSSTCTATAVEDAVGPSA
jgi:hypothetical protein